MSPPRRFDPLSYLEHHVAVGGDRPAILDDDETITFSALRRAVHAFAGVLLDRGVRPGDVVAVALPNVWRYVALELAVQDIGAILLPIPPRLGEYEVESALTRTSAVLLITDGAWPDAHPNTIDVDRLPTEGRSDVEARRSADPDRVVQIALTSGTTGLPKLASLTARLKQLTFEGFTARLGLEADDRMLPMSPITQGVGEMCLYALRVGATIVMTHGHRFDPDATLRAIERSGATVLGGVPTMVGRLLHAASLPGTDLTTLRATVTAGSTLPRDLAESWERRSGSATCSFYGAMDIGQLAVPEPDRDPAEKRWTTVGRPHDSAEWRISDPASGETLPTGEVGDVCMRGPLVQDRYWGEEHGPYGDDGWAHFGDLGFVDEDGYLHIVGRIKDTIIRGGDNINPLEIEQHLRTHPSVSDVCVIGRPDPDLGERAVAFVVTSLPDFDVTTAAELLAARGVARYKWPETVVRTDSLPLAGTGKVDRAALRRLLPSTTDGGEPLAAEQ